MTRERPPTPPHRAVAKANAALLARLDLTVEQGAETCWACGAGRGSDGSLGWLQRAHVVAAAAGGDDSPANFFLLCAVCHREQPDGAPRAAQEAWLRAHESQVERLTRLAAPAARWAGEMLVDLSPTASELVDAHAVALQGARSGKGAAHTGNELASAAWNVAVQTVDELRRKRGKE